MGCDLCNNARTCRDIRVLLISLVSLRIDHFCHRSYTMNETTPTAGGVPEMGKYLRQIVDNSLEEGQFESAIAMLEQLRSPDHKPSV